MISKIKITSGEADTEILIDGLPLRGVKSWTLHQNAGEIPVLTVDLIARNRTVEVKGKVRVKRPHKMWTKAEEAKLLELYYDPECYSKTQIGEIMGRSAASIDRKLQSLRAQKRV